MSGIDRRRFLRGAAVSSAAAAAMAAGPGAAWASGGRGDEQRRTPNDPDAPGPSQGWEVPESTLPADPADNPIEHIGVLMMENRSYDTYLGWLDGGRGFLNLGLDISYTDPDDPSVSASPEHWAPKYRRCGHPDPGHNWTEGRKQLRDGFLAGRNDEYALAYYLAEDISTYARIARQFTVFDRYFCSVLAGGSCNRSRRGTRTPRTSASASTFDRAPRLEYGIDQMETPTIYQSTGCDTGPPAPDDFERLAESSYLRSLGVEVGEPSLDEIFGNAAAVTDAAGTSLPTPGVQLP